jgi:hypothetical protein
MVARFFPNNNVISDLVQFEVLFCKGYDSHYGEQQYIGRRLHITGVKTITIDYWAPNYRGAFWSLRMASSRQSHKAVYVKDQLTVQRELVDAIDIKFLPTLQAIFKTREWLLQSQPVPQRMIRGLCPRNPRRDNKVICAFCPDATFATPDRAIEHIQKDHFGMRPFSCTTVNWWGASSHIKGLPVSLNLQWKDILAQK